MINMKYKLNKLETKTTDNFKVNELEIDLEVKPFNTKKIYEIEGLNISQTIKNKKITSKVGLDFNKYLEVEINITKSSQKPLLLNYYFEKENSLISKLKIIYEKDISRDIIIRYQSIDSMNHFNFLVETIEMKENSTGTITYLNNLNSKSTNIISYEGRLADNSSITHNIIDLGGNIRIYNASIESIGNYSKNYFNNLYIGKDNDIIDMNYLFKNKGEKSLNELKVEGLLKDNATKVFKGTIDFLKGTKKAIGKESENCLLLSDTAISRSLPMMLCHEEDVEGSHGVSTGKVSKDKLFYLMTRGLSKKEAERLIVKANFNSVIQSIKEEKIQEEILEKIENMI